MANIIHVPRGVEILPDNRDYTNRFHIHSETSNRVYVVAQHKTKRHWSCSCPGWLTNRKCKHLQTMGLPCFERPFEAILQK
jgi:hypothetical protein